MSSSDRKSVEVVWHNGNVQAKDRSLLLGQRPRLTIWLTGLSAFGKLTLAFALDRHLVDIGHACYVLNGDNLRHKLNEDLGGSCQDRTENIRRTTEVARLTNDAGLIVIAAFISPCRGRRKFVQHIIGSEHFVEIYLNTFIQVCEARDPKGLYKRARAVKISGFTGVNDPYESPVSPFLAIDTSSAPFKKGAEKLLSALISRINLAESYKQEKLENAR